MHFSFLIITGLNPLPLNGMPHLSAKLNILLLTCNDFASLRIEEKCYYPSQEHYYY